VVVKQN